MSPRAKKAMPLFKDRYILAEGYPWAMGIGPYKTVGMHSHQRFSSLTDLDFPAELWKPDLPKYRLVLERIDD